MRLFERILLVQHPLRRSDLDLELCLQEALGGLTPDAFSLDVYVCLLRHAGRTGPETHGSSSSAACVVDWWGAFLRLSGPLFPSRFIDTMVRRESSPSHMEQQGPPHGCS